MLLLVAYDSRFGSQVEESSAAKEGAVDLNVLVQLAAAAAAALWWRAGVCQLGATAVHALRVDAAVAYSLLREPTEGFNARRPLARADQSRLGLSRSCSRLDGQCCGCAGKPNSINGFFCRSASATANPPLNASPAPVVSTMMSTGKAGT